MRDLHHPPGGSPTAPRQCSTIRCSFPVRCRAHTRPWRPGRPLLCVAALYAATWGAALYTAAPHPAAYAEVNRPDPVPGDPALLQRLTADEAPEGVLLLRNIEMNWMAVGAGAPQPDRNLSGQPIRIGDLTFPRGVVCRAPVEWLIALDDTAEGLELALGVEAEAPPDASVLFHLWVDGREVLTAGPMHRGSPPRLVSLDLSGAHRLILAAEVPEEQEDLHSPVVFGGGLFYLRPDANARPRGVPNFGDESDPDIAPPILPDRPRLCRPDIWGATPGKPILFRIAAVGRGPLRFEAGLLPDGLTLDPERGLLTGAVASSGRFDLPVRVTGPGGSSEGTLTLIIGDDAPARTPPMGWNSWYVWAGHVDDARVRAAADAMEASGMAARGWRYIVIDDCWQGQRGQDGVLYGNERFPDLPGLVEYVHRRGLLFGLYSSPGPGTCAGYPGSFGHEEQDARTLARWGVDFLKYDWCSYGRIAPDPSRASWMAPYRKMADLLRDQNRDILFSICQYGEAAVWEWGRAAGGHLWRTTGDMVDRWAEMIRIGMRQEPLAPWAGPGGWNDPDMLQVGLLGMSASPRPSNLTRHEQLTQMTLWCLLSAPLFVSCDLTRLDDFTRALLLNEEVLAIDQDRLGIPARRAARDGPCQAWVKPLDDGGWAVGLFNLGRTAAPYRVPLTRIGLPPADSARNLWRRQDLRLINGILEADLPPHSAALFRIPPPGKSSQPPAPADQGLLPLTQQYPQAGAFTAA